MTIVLRRSSAFLLSLLLCATVVAWIGPPWPALEAHPGHGGGGSGEAVPATPLGRTPCVDGFAGGYPCARIDVESFMPTGMIGGGRTNDIWGWTDPLTSREYALVGRTTGTSFVRFVLSKNGKVDAGDVELATHPVAALGPGQNRTATTSVVIPTETAPGVYQIIAIADLNVDVDECDETNNVRTRKITIQ